MSEQLLTLLKFSLLAVLYLFLFRVVRAVWAEITPPVPGGAPPRRRARRAAAVAPAGATMTPAAAAAARQGRTTTASAPPPAARKGRSKPATLVVVEPAETKGTTFAVPDEATIGRGGGCQITVADTFASQLHARVFRTNGTLFVEDLGSTNGTFLNGTKVGGPQPLRKGDRLKVGSTVMELR